MKRILCLIWIFLMMAGWASTLYAGDAAQPLLIAGADGLDQCRQGQVTGGD
ncbi:MAG TPA: hypothetical protein PL176_04020 [Kiritimatiellia bacterium]|nr:hypothetical protein [Kiritimatiellia bacterium]